MRTTVYFVTNRRHDTAAPPAARFSALMAPPGEGRLSFGTAFVDGTNPDPAALATGHITDIGDIGADRFAPAMEDDIVGGGKNLLVFVHGFANSFSEAITRAAFNREWLAASGTAAADCTVVAFTWPSPGLVVDPRDVVPGTVLSLFTLLGFALSHELRNPLTRRYLDDQSSARNSGLDLASALDRMAPLFARVRARGGEVFLLVHSMGHIAVQGAIDGWTTAGLTPAPLFDHAILAAADANAELAGRSPPWLAALPRWSAAFSLYHSRADQVLMVSESVNGVRRLGESGPPDSGDTARYPAQLCRFVDCTGVQDTDPSGQAIDFTHQYYRRIPKVRDDIAAALGGGGAPGRVALA